MLNWLDSVMRAEPMLVFAVVVAIGYLLGKIRFKGFELGGVAGVLFAALVFGHFGYEGSSVLQMMGFVFFMYVVGYEAGPEFFAVVMRDGLKYLMLSLVVAAAGFATVLILHRLLALPPGAAAGILAGGMTTTPTLAAAQDAVTSGQVVLPEGVSEQDVVANIGAAYAITYLFGLLGMIGIIKIAPRLLRVDLEDDARSIERASPRASDQPVEPIHMRAYRICEGLKIVGETRRQFEERLQRQVKIERLRRAGEFVDLTDDTVIQNGDEVTAVGFLSALRLASHVGIEELDDSTMLDLHTESAQIVVTKRRAVGMTLAELGMRHRFGAFVQHVRRLGVRIEPTPALRLQRGDVLRVTAPSSHLTVLGNHVGHLEREIEQADPVTYMAGMGLGLILGSITIVVGGVPVGLGMAGGLLIVGVLVGFLRSIHPTFGRMPGASRWLAMELGLLFFMAGVGLDAGQGILETLRSAGLSLFISGVIVTVIPLVAAWIVGRYLLRIRPAPLMGGITGAMTNTACLKLVNERARSSVPALGYAGAYAFANVILTVAGSLIARFTLG